MLCLGISSSAVAAGVSVVILLWVLNQKSVLWWRRACLGIKLQSIKWHTRGQAITFVRDWLLGLHPRHKARRCGSLGLGFGAHAAWRLKCAHTLCSTRTCERGGHL